MSLKLYFIVCNCSIAHKRSHINMVFCTNYKVLFHQKHPSNPLMGANALKIMVKYNITQSDTNWVDSGRLRSLTVPNKN